MNITVLGATGRTGQPLVAELLNRGHDVTVLVRDPAKLGSSAAQVRIITGSVEDRAALAEAITGSDAVISALGPVNRDSQLHTPLAQTLLELLPTLGVERFIGISGAGVDFPGDQKRLPDRIVSRMIRLTSGALWRDKTTEIGVFAGSDLQWTLVRPPRLLDGPATGSVYSDAKRPGTSKITRVDLAVFMVDVLEQQQYLRQAPFVSQAA